MARFAFYRRFSASNAFSQATHATRVNGRFCGDLRHLRTDRATGISSACQDSPGGSAEPRLITKRTGTDGHADRFWAYALARGGAAAGARVLSWGPTGVTADGERRRLSYLEGATDLKTSVNTPLSPKGTPDDDERWRGSRSLAQPGLSLG